MLEKNQQTWGSIFAKNAKRLKHQPKREPISIILFACSTVHLFCIRNKLNHLLLIKGILYNYLQQKEMIAG